MIIRQSTAVDVLIGPFVDLIDGATAETGETPVVKLSKNGQALAAKSDVTVPVHDADGYYNCKFDATDTNTVGTLVLTVAKSATALPVRHEFQVMETAVYDALYADAAAGYATSAALTTVENKIDTIDGIVDAILVDTGTTLDARLPAALVGGRMDSSTGAMAANVMTAAAAAADLTTELQSGLATSASITTLQTSVDDLPTNAELATALGTADDAVLAAISTTDGKVTLIKAKTDSLTFTKAGEVDANLQSVNDVTVNGDGAGTPMGV